MRILHESFYFKDENDSEIEVCWPENNKLNTVSFDKYDNNIDVSIDFKKFFEWMTLVNEELKKENT